MAGDSHPLRVGIHWLLKAEEAGSMDLAPLEAAVGRALSAESLAGPVDLSITLTGDEQIRQLNAAYRGLDEVTDVLSFPQMEGPTDFVTAPDGVLHLGDVVVSLPQARRQAAEADHRLGEELAQLIVHGALHLVGYDHTEEAGAVAMQARERAALTG